VTAVGSVQPACLAEDAIMYAIAFTFITRVAANPCALHGARDQWQGGRIGTTGHIVKQTTSGISFAVDIHE
jgi:hypothetical protein